MQMGYICFFIHKHLEPFCTHPSNCTVKHADEFHLNLKIYALSLFKKTH